MLAVLVVEQDAMTRDTIIDMVEAVGHVAVGANSPETAFRLLGKAGFDVMIVSLRESDRDGAQVAAAAKSIFPKVQVMVVSGRAIGQTLSPDVDAFVQKPFDLATIDQALTALTE